MSKRIYAGLIDLVVAGLIQAPLMLLFLIIPMRNGEIEISQVIARNIIITYISMMYFVFRDNIGKKSIGKRLMNLEIYDKNHNTHEVTFGKRLLRNIPWLLGPLELIVFLFFGRRIGDMITNLEITQQKELR